MKRFYEHMNEHLLARESSEVDVWDEHFYRIMSIRDLIDIHVCTLPLISVDMSTGPSPSFPEVAFRQARCMATGSAMDITIHCYCKPQCQVMVLY